MLLSNDHSFHPPLRHENSVRLPRGGYFGSPARNSVWNPQAESGRHDGGKLTKGVRGEACKRNEAEPLGEIHSEIHGDIDKI